MTAKYSITRISLLFTLMSLCAGFDGVKAAEVCAVGQTQLCGCPDSSTGIQNCAEDGTDWQACSCLWYDAWYDGETNLSWQNPQKDAYSEDNQGVTSFDAIRYCAELVTRGHDDWRAPTIDELRTIIRGAPRSRAGGACKVTAGSKLGGASMVDIMACGGQLKPFQCKGSGNCCWNEALTGTCNTVDPASTTHYLEYWSSTPAVDDPDNWIGFVFFDTGTVGFNHSLSFGEVRCVRDGPVIETAQMETDGNACVSGETRRCTCANDKPGAQACGTDGSGFTACQCTGFTPSPGPVDVCAGGDTVKVTVNVPEKLEKQPYMLATFLYKEGEVDMRPPDVGIDENEIRYPAIDVDKPMTITLPGCSYYRDRRMTGDYFLSVYLKMDEGKFPGPPGLNDMSWSGAGSNPITLTGDGSKHYEFDVTVAPIFKRKK
ncbi:MAG TPA: DUF1566 domain-containing protein [Gammaproteobacteria bacterium]|nr:hypothetical protein [Chromatiales bacterium]MCP4924629.1 DUF1566 domain-containing protein [Gammaproteobacteria bacterium]MDP7154448.1 DUF1566 domain-containing protein [Gammaproteobacteria bacterium]MDP7296473.1 DUF1566 domain-containing protein [Gammaproteobacteria bacterium]HJP38622.1 DUF1566 domain-containing protein [Gammaproteobacteria bacterium]